MKSDKKSIYDSITSEIIKQLEQGVKPWEKSWQSGSVPFLPLRSCGEPYRGINILHLWMVSEKHGYNLPNWFTYKQAKDAGAQVRKGEKGSQVVYFQQIVKNEVVEGNEETKAFPMMKAYSVFNACQIDGLPENFYKQAEPLTEREKLERLPEMEMYFENLGLNLNHGGNRAYYRPSSDSIQMPLIDDFKNIESYYATLAHESTHWTKKENRCNRDFGRKRWGDEGYAAEELVAEMGSAFLCASLGVSLAPREDHASYIDHWIKVLKNDNRAIFTASGYAQKAMTFMDDLQVGMEVVAV